MSTLTRGETLTCEADAATIVAALQAAGVEADASSRRLAEYAYDASNYRLRPLLVAFPRSGAQVRTAVRVAGAHGASIIVRGGGTSMAGNAIGIGVVLDLSRYMRAIGPVDEAGGTVEAQPGVVLSTLTNHVEAVTGGRLTFAPDPSSKTRATLGGAIGNDACGNHSVRYGRTSDHVVELDVVLSDGSALTVFRGGLRATDPDDVVSVARAAELNDHLMQLARTHLADLRTHLGRIPRQVSGYHLRHLLPEEGFDVARALVGSEGTCVIVVGARMRLVERPSSALLVCLGYDDVVDAALDVPMILSEDPAAVEGIDSAIVETMRWRRGDDAVAGMPAGSAWLYVDLDGDDLDRVRERAERLIERCAAAGRLVEGRVVADGVDRAKLWRVREDGAGLSARLAPHLAPGRGESWPGWEDAAVAPEALADYLRDLRALLEQHGLEGVMYGHFGAGCMHVRITYDLRTPAGRAVFEQFTSAAARLVVAHGGSLSGEHGDGRARSALLPIMYPPSILAAFAQFKQAWDPQKRFGPGSIVDPAEFVDDLALAAVPDRAWPTTFHLPRTQGQDPFVHAVQSCIGVGRCRSDSGGVMCPSYRATRDEKDSTRGRARVLQEIVRNAPSPEAGWRSDEVREALDLCLSCKACSSDCPVGVDMATYKSEFFDHYYAGRLRPRSHYSLGELPRLLAVAARVPGSTRVANALLSGPLGGTAMRAAGLTDRRRPPRLAEPDAWIRQVAAAGADRPGSGTGDVLILVDSFTRGFRPQVAGAATAVLREAGEDVEIAPDACCGLTWISTGRLSAARRVLTRAVKVLDDDTQRPIVVLEPSCAAAFASDLPELLGTPAARRVGAPRTQLRPACRRPGRPRPTRPVRRSIA
ncbi:FAD-binding and (Fe-S)-binding domain-containing protein [Gephyromycinifex aptenodytis]|uniref:FAD-binding and (Fe-S)-binding domain-containing protein n=1 Tax=Gephyromycinifex aptenodytis TaxID=2716227 RepID=UPI0029CAA435|nr:FAD-binding and (Fe-S)-binding domain-containing protein [Gephyromycinifex aptenodytis]